MAKTMEKELVLVGSTRYDYVDSLRAAIENMNAVWTGWNFKIRNEWRNVISERIKTDGQFPVYFYLSKIKGGSGFVEYVATATEIRMSDVPIPSPDPKLTNPSEEDFPTDDFKTYTWFKLSAVELVGPLDIRSFSDIDTEEPVSPSQMRSAFAYAFLSEEIEVSPEVETPLVSPAITVERDLRKYLIQNLNSLEKGLKLHQEQDQNGEEYAIEAGKMRIDILARDKEGALVVIELKAGVADLATFGQISAYMGWTKNNLAKNGKVRGIIVANHFEEKVKFAVQSVSNIKLKRYSLRFEFSDEKI